MSQYLKTKLYSGPVVGILAHRVSSGAKIGQAQRESQIELVQINSVLRVVQ